METINRCKLSTDIHKKAQELLYGYGLSDTFVELDIVWKHPQFKFKMRSIIDRLIVDESTKTIIVVDLKTTAKNVHKFLRAYEMYGYYKQLALYRQAAIWYAKEVLELDISDWTFEEYIVAVQTTGYNECVVYKPSADDLKQGSTETLVALKRMEWHFDNDKWDFPKEYYEGDGVITLNLNEE